MEENYEKRLRRLEEEAISRVHWGEDVMVVHNSLVTKGHITNREAEEIIIRAVKARNQEIRGRALIGMAAWGFGVFVFGGPIVLMGLHDTGISLVTLILLVVAAPSTFFFLKAVWSYISCEKTDPMK